MSEHPHNQTRLVQRLRALVYHINETGTADQTDKQTVREAADEIESLRARLEKAEAERDDASASRKFWMDAWHTLDQDHRILRDALTDLKDKS